MLKMFPMHYRLVLNEQQWLKRFRKGKIHLPKLRLHRKLIVYVKRSHFLNFISDVEVGFTGPCGSCRQTLAEFGLDLDVYLVNTKNESKLYTLRELLPIAFTPSDLQKPRTSHDIID